MRHLQAAEARLHNMAVDVPGNSLPKKREFKDIMEQVRQNRRESFLSAIQEKVKSREAKSSTAAIDLHEADLSQQYLQDLGLIYHRYADEVTKTLSLPDLLRLLQDLHFNVTESSLRQLLEKNHMINPKSFDMKDFMFFVAKLGFARSLSYELDLGFKNFDLLGTGRVTLEDLRNLNEISGLGLTEQELMDMLCVADKNGDGEVDFAEFSEVMRKTPMFS